MTNQTITQSQKRIQDSIASLFLSNDDGKCDFLFLTSSTDIGVQRNGGRNGARLAPQSLLSYIKKLNKKPSLEHKSFIQREVALEDEERADFHDAQNRQADRISKNLKLFPESFLCHIGGGHDHIFPLLMALGKDFKRVIVINIDAHADTRTDSDFHSGTPFRQFSTIFKKDFHLFQIGLLEFANSQSTLIPLENGDQQILWRRELTTPNKLAQFFKCIQEKMNSETVVVFSIDADALDGSLVPGVSAVNGKGLSLNELDQVWKAYRQLPIAHKPIIGIYELNPVYDTLSMMSMRTIGAFLFDCF